MNGYPIQPTKVQRPPLRDETLARDRLLDWLGVKIHNRVVLVTAEAGYGKTTLLADFSRRSRLRILWYRLDDEDRTWIPFVSYLVAAGRQHDPGFAPKTAALLNDIGSAAPSRDAVIDSFVREFQTLGEHGAVVIFDDFHVVDDASDVREIVQALLTHAPERVTFVFASRRTPGLRVARLRAQGEVAELTTDDLRFNRTETERLFRETYGRPLEPDVLADLSNRTEGWAASLQLVQAAIRDRSSTQIRSFVRSLTGAEGDLYDYLAEEVVGDLPEELQNFLMRTSILETVDPRLAEVATGADAASVATFIAASELVGLLGRSGRSARGHRFHPLVQQFLQNRLAGELGADGVGALHQEVARASEVRDWQTACHHYLAAGDAVDLRRILKANLPSIVGNGLFARAQEYIDQLPPELRQGALQIVSSRIRLQQGDLEGAAGQAQSAIAADGDTETAGLALASLLTVQMNAADFDAMRVTAEALLSLRPDPNLEAIARGTMEIFEAFAGPLGPLVEHLRVMADLQQSAGLNHYFGITMLNLSYIYRHMADAEKCFAACNAAIDALSDSAGRGEKLLALGNRAWSHAHRGNWSLAEADVSAALAGEASPWLAEAATEIVEIYGFYHDPEIAARLVAEASGMEVLPSIRPELELARLRSLARTGQASAALQLLEETTQTATTAAFASVSAVTEAYVRACARDPGAAAAATRAVSIAGRQGAHFWKHLSEVILASTAESVDFADGMKIWASAHPVYLSAVAELIAPRLGDLDEATRLLVVREASMRPERWRLILRRCVREGEISIAAPAARVLDEIGTAQDIQLLRSFGRRQRRSPALGTVGRALARRVAQRITIEDLGRVRVFRGTVEVRASEIRRKVLALLCLLAAQPDLSATRDMVLDSLWPDLEPVSATNSLNQTLYFLRRVFEPDYQEDLSPGYVHHEGELVWLDRDLISSQSARCRQLVSALEASPRPEQVLALSAAYTGRFALDFEYEDWAAPFRDWLHASYLEVVERAVKADTKAGEFDRGILLARRALEVDPGAEQIELSLLRLYRLSGAHAAAAEQYTHYAAILREDLGVEPPPLESL